MVTCLACGVCLMIAMLACGGLASDETCADMEFEGLTQDVTVSVQKDTYINVTFFLNTSKCPEDGNSFRIKVLANQGGFSVSVCVFVIKKTNCSLTEKSDVCHCLPDTGGWARMFHLPNDTGLVTCIFRWNGVGSTTSHELASINFDVFSTTTTHSLTTAEELSSTSTEGEVDKTNTSSGTVTASTTKSITSPEDMTERGIAAGIQTTSPGLSETKSEDDNFQVIFFTSIITALVIGVPFVTGIVIYVYKVKKRRKVDQLYLSASTGRHIAVESEGCMKEPGHIFPFATSLQHTLKDGFPNHKAEEPFAPDSDKFGHITSESLPSVSLRADVWPLATTSQETLVCIA